MLNLIDIHDSVAQVAEAIATVVQVDVEVVNTNYIRVAGTGKYADHVGESMGSNYVYQKILADKIDVFIPNPGQHPFCNSYPEKEHCVECAELAAPIFLNDRAIGVFGMIAFNETQRDLLVRYQNEFLEFIKQMGQMIAAKMNESLFIKELMITQKQLEAIIDSVNEGIIAIDTEGQITHCNHSAEVLLHRSRHEIINQSFQNMGLKTHMLDVLETGVGYINREITYNEHNQYFLSTARPILNQGQIAGVVASFLPITEVKQLILDYTEHQIDIPINEIVGTSQTMVDLRANILRFAHSSSTVLIRGESGTGKELVARAIHSNSPRKDKPFIAINCSAIPDTLLESELFGYEEGSFTGAKRKGKPGKFEMADGGTLFLDEIGDMPIHLQSKILRALQEKTIERVGGNFSITLNLRIISATNRPLEEMITQGQFREDLYYRLNVIPIFTTPLRERTDDTPSLLEHFTQKYNRLFNKSIKGFSEQAITAIMNYPWPGNVRELENAIEYAFNIETSTYILANSLPAKMREVNTHTSPSRVRSLDEVEKEAIQAALNHYGRNVDGKKNAAKALGIGIATLYRKANLYGL